MAYASITHVQNHIPARTFTSTSKPTATGVAQFLDEAAGCMDSALTAAGYSVPVPMGTTSVASSVQAELQKINAVGACYMVEAAAPVSSGRREEFQQMWESALKMLEKGELPGLAKDSGSSSPRTNAVATPFFTRDMIL